jgi:DNA polymerase-3 subunit delta
VLAAVQARTFEPVYYIYGEDDYRKDKAVRELIEAAVDPATRDFNSEARRGGELTAESINDVLGTPPMLAERRAVVIRDVGALKKAARTGLDKYLARPAADTLLLLVTPAGGKTDDALARDLETLQFEPLPPERVRKWIQHHAKTELHAAITDEAAQLLQQSVGDDLQAMAGELDKCVSYALGAQETANAARGNERSVASETTVTIDADAVSAVVGIRRGETVTDLLDAIARHDTNASMLLIPHVLSQRKVTAVQIVIFLSTQAFALSYGRARREAGVPTGKLTAEFFAFLKETGGYPGRPWGEAASMWTKQVDGWSTIACARALELLLEADIALKETTVSDAEQIFTSLVLALCALKPRSRKAA